MVPTTNGTMIPAFELMHINSASKGMIRDNKNYQIENAMSTGRAEGMRLMDQSILKLYQEGIIAKDTALSYADHPDQLVKHLNG